MSIKINFNGQTILKPGSYSTLDASLLTTPQLGDSGIVGIIGEADAGQPGVLDIISPSGFQSAKLRYKNGPIAKVLELLANPAKDFRIPGGASRVVIYKTNNSTQATKTLSNLLNSPVAQINLTSKNYGLDENKTNIQISQGDIPDQNASIVSSEEGPYALSGSDTLVVSHAGADYTYTSSLGAGSQTLGDIVDDLNNAANWSASKPIVAEAITVGAATFIKLTLVNIADVSRLEYGVMAILAASDLDTILGFSNDPVRGIKGNRIITENKNLETNISESIGGAAMLNVLYTGAGTAATLSIQNVSGVKTLTTSITGGDASETLSIQLDDSITLKQLEEQINANAGFSCSSVFFNKASVLAKDVLDYYNNIDIETMNCVLYNTVMALVDYINASSNFFTAVVAPDIIGQVATISTASFFTDGTKGASSNSNFQAGFDAFKNIRINTVVPLVSKDGISPSTYTVDSVNAQADAHCAFMCSIQGRSERNAFVSKNGAKDVLKSAARAINSRHTSLVGQKITALNNQGTLEQFEEYGLACILAGMQAGSPVGEPSTFKQINAVALAQDASWDPKIDYNEMIEAGVCFAEQTDSGAFAIVVANTTYSKDNNEVFNRVHINESANFVSYELRQHLNALFVGNKARTGTASAIVNAAISKLEQLRAEDIIVDGNEPDGTIIPAYRNISVNISGVTATLSVTITPVPGVDFILQTLYLEGLKASASA